jgi:hypothetical protein
MQVSVRAQVESYIQRIRTLSISIARKTGDVGESLDLITSVDELISVITPIIYKTNLKERQRGISEITFSIDTESQILRARWPSGICHLVNNTDYNAFIAIIESAGKGFAVKDVTDERPKTLFRTCLRLWIRWPDPIIKRKKSRYYPEPLFNEKAQKIWNDLATKGPQILAPIS